MPEINITISKNKVISQLFIPDFFASNEVTTDVIPLTINHSEKIQSIITPKIKRIPDINIASNVKLLLPLFLRQYPAHQKPFHFLIHFLFHNLIIKHIPHIPSKIVTKQPLFRKVSPGLKIQILMQLSKKHQKYTCELSSRYLPILFAVLVISCLKVCMLNIFSIAFITILLRNSL